MNYRDFKAAVAFDDIEPKNYEQIVFRTPDGTNYHNVTIDFGYWNNTKDKAMIVNLFNIKPKFHVGDVVTNISGLYPNVTPTINEVDIINQCYRYKEIGGVTWFKEQDKLKLVDAKPIFKVGDKVKGASSEEPEKEFIINSINEDIKCYHYFNGNGIITMFKDQHKLSLVQTDNCRHPVEDEIKPASTVKINPSIITADELRHNKDIYDIYALIVQEMMCAIKRDAKQGKNKAHFIISTRNISVFQLGQDFTNAGYKVSAVIGNDKNSTLDIEW